MVYAYVFFSRFLVSLFHQGAPRVVWKSLPNLKLVSSHVSTVSSQPGKLVWEGQQDLDQELLMSAGLVEEVSWPTRPTKTICARIAGKADIYTVTWLFYWFSSLWKTNQVLGLNQLQTDGSTSPELAPSSHWGTGCNRGHKSLAVVLKFWFWALKICSGMCKGLKFLFVDPRFWFWC